MRFYCSCFFHICICKALSNCVVYKGNQYSWRDFKTAFNKALDEIVLDIGTTSTFAILTTNMHSLPRIPTSKWRDFVQRFS